MEIQAILAQLAGDLKLPDLKLNESNALRLTFDRVLHVDLEYDPGLKVAHLHSEVAPVPGKGAKESLLTLLEANAFGQGTAGSAFAVDSLHQNIVLSRSVAMDQTGYAEFTQILEGFVHTLETWKERMTNLAPPPPNESVERLSSNSRPIWG